MSGKRIGTERSKTQIDKLRKTDKEHNAPSSMHQIHRLWDHNRRSLTDFGRAVPNSRPKCYPKPGAGTYHWIVARDEKRGNILRIDVVKNA